MKLYLWKDLNKVSDNYHDNGGAVVVAKDEKEARALIAKDANLEVEEDEWREVKVFDLDNTRSYISEIIVFPNAGCC